MLITPHFVSDNPTLNSAYRIAIGDLVGNIQPFQDGLLEEPQPCILAGLEYNTPWTRDTAINIWNGSGLIFPDVSRNTLLSVLKHDEAGLLRIGGQYWDSIIWTSGAWAYYLYTGDSEILSLAYQATLNSLKYFEETEYNPSTELFQGPACYGDGVAAYPDRYAKTNGSSSILDWPINNPGDKALRGFGIPMQALSTNCLYYQAYRLVNKMAVELGQTSDRAYEIKADRLKTAINHYFWDDDLQNYRYLVDIWGGSNHQEGMGSSFALLFGIASPEQAMAILRSQVITPFGIPCVWPTFDRYKLDENSFGRHSGTVWPHIQGFWAEAAARLGDLKRFSFELFKLAGLAVRDGMFAEIYHPFRGDSYGGLQEGAPGWHWRSCIRQTWSATAFLRMVYLGLVGMDFSPKGITLTPSMPEGISHLKIKGLKFRKAILNITIEGQGSKIIESRLNDHLVEQPFINAGAEGSENISIQLG